MEMLQKPQTLSRTLNSALISWENIFPTTTINTKYILQMENSVHEWKNIYWGPKRQFLVENLAPCSYYNFRLKIADEKENWINFKSGTDAIPYFVVHFTRAVKFGKTPVIRKIINKRPILLETENKEGKTPLIQAIESKNLQMVAFLINLGANVNTATLITKHKGANLHAKDCNFLTALHHAVDSGNLENVQFCLNHEFDINAKDNKGWTPLLRAVVLNIPDEIVVVLLKKGADFSIKDKNGFDFYKHLKVVNRINLEQFVINQKEDGMEMKKES